MKNIALLALLSFACNAHADGNFWSNAGAMQRGADETNSAQQRNQCVSGCTPGDGACYRACVAAFDAPRPAPPQTDQLCVSDCVVKGYLYDMCVKRCSF